MVYCKSLISYLNRVSNVSKNTLKVTPYRTNAVTQSQIIVVDMPNNAMIDLDTLVFHFKGTTDSTDVVEFPRHIESLIAKINVELNGMSIGSCNHLSDLYNIMYNLTMGMDAYNKRSLYQIHNPTGENVVSRPYKINNWLGLVGSIQGRVLDLGVIGSMRLHITLEGTNVLVKSEESTNESYTLDDLYFTVDSVSVDDGVYYAAKAAFLNSGGIIELPFDNYYSSLFSVSSYTQSSRFSVSTNSLDYILACFPRTRSLSTGVGYDGYFRYAADDGSTDGLVDWSFNVNNIQLPQFKALKDDAFCLLENVMGISQTMDGGIDPAIQSRTTWNQKTWCAAVRLNLLTDVDERTISGLSTQGTNSTIAFETTGTGSINPNNLLIFAKSSAVLRVGAGKTLELVM
jgi:hypothetical protein